MLKEKCKEYYEYRGVLGALIKNNLVGRYKNSLLGFGWHFVMPVIMIFVYYISFSAMNESSGEQYWLYIATGIFPFNFMITNLSAGSSCISSYGQYINKMYFPRELVVFAQVFSTGIIMLIGVVIVLLLHIFLEGMVSLPFLVMLLVLIVLQILFVMGYVLLFSSVNVYVRDVQHFLNTISIVFFFITPVYFTLDQMAPAMVDLMHLNPFSYFILAFHDVMYYGHMPECEIMWSCIFLTCVFIVLGIFVFNKLKKGFVERV